MEHKVYGIDLGTTNSAIAVYEKDDAVILKNIDGDEITPSVVFFTGMDNDGKDETLVGMMAKNSAAAAPEQVVQFVKRYMGSHGDAYNFISPSGTAYTPEMISALILRKVCQDAEQYVGGDAVKDVVITVPAYFDDARRIATKHAGQLAGLNVLRVINEPTAAAIAFGLDVNHQGKVLVYDLGGGTFDVTIMEINNGRFDVIATDGDSQLGGINFDQKLMTIIIRRLVEMGCTIDDEDDALMADIREKAEKTKLQLSNVETARPVFTVGGKTARIEITRADFEEECKALLQRTQFLLEDMMEANNITWADIDQLLMVGGSTRMPMVKQMLEEISGKEVVYKVDPDTAVARGAAIFASTLGSGNGEDVGNAGAAHNHGAGNVDPSANAARVTVSDVTSQSLGVVTVDDRNHEQNTIIIPNNTKIPVKIGKEVYTVSDNQTRILVQVTEGNDPELEFVRIIGESTLNIPAYPKGSPVEIIYAYDADQTIYIEVIDKVTNQSLGTFEIARTSNMTKEEISDAIRVVSGTNVD